MKWQELMKQPNGTVFCEDDLPPMPLFIKRETLEDDIMVEPLFVPNDGGEVRMGWREKEDFWLNSVDYHVLEADEVQLVAKRLQNALSGEVEKPVDETLDNQEKKITAQLDRYVRQHYADNPILTHAYYETDHWRQSDDEMDTMMADHVMRLMAVFAMEGHSGMSAAFARGAVERLMDFKPLRPLTGEDDEWVDVGEGHEKETLYQNRRCSKVFKHSDQDKAHILDYFVFHDGDHIYFTSKESSVEIDFPYTPFDKPVVIEVANDEQDRNEAIRRHGYDPQTGQKLAEGEAS